MLLQIDLDMVTSPKCRKKLKEEEKWLNPKKFPNTEHDWIIAVADCEKLFMGYNLIGEAGKILRAWLIQNVLMDVRSELRKVKMEKGLLKTLFLIG